MALRSGATLLLLLLAAACIVGAAPAEPAPALSSTEPASQRLADATTTFYGRLGSSRAWVGHPERLDPLRRVLLELRDDGLTPAHYGVGLIDAATTEADPKAQDALDLQLTRGFLLAMIHVYRGKLDPHELDAVWNVERRPVDLDAALAEATDAVAQGRIEAFARRARPEHPFYGRLRDALSQLYRTQEQGGWGAIDEGPTIEPGASDLRVPQLRRRLARGGYLPGFAGGDETDLVYDAALQSAVKRFQEFQYLDADARVGRQTVAAMNVPIEQRIAQLRANLERSRWLLHQLGDDLVVVDIAGYRLHFIQRGVRVFTTRVQVGKPIRRTPIFGSLITHLTLNPTWVMPPTIFKEDALPRIRRDLGYLSDQRLRVLDARGRELDPRAIDWRAPPPGLLLRQDAGPDGALGRIAIRFPNPYAVYLHETPNAQLFSSSQRAFSSGCIRVEAPVDLALLLLGSDSGWTPDTLDTAFATRRTREVTLPRPVPILLMYWTADLHLDGPPGFKPDIYGLDAAVIEALDRLPAPP